VLQGVGWLVCLLVCSFVDWLVGQSVGRSVGQEFMFHHFSSSKTRRTCRIKTVLIVMHYAFILRLYFVRINSDFRNLMFF